MWLGLCISSVCSVRIVGLCVLLVVWVSLCVSIGCVLVGLLVSISSVVLICDVWFEFGVYWCYRFVVDSVLVGFCVLSVILVVCCVMCGLCVLWVSVR